MIQLLTESNQNLLNQARTKDLGTLAGLTMMTNPQTEESYVSTDEREMAAYYDAMSRMHMEPEFDSQMEEDMEILRSTM